MKLSEKSHQFWTKAGLISLISAFLILVSNLPAQIIHSGGEYSEYREEFSNEIVQNLKAHSDSFESALVVFYKNETYGVVEYPENQNATYEIASLSKLMIQQVLFKHQQQFDDGNEYKLHEVKFGNMDIINESVVINGNQFGYPDYDHVVTYGDLMSHRSGIIEDRNGFVSFFEPGVYQQYENLNYKLLIDAFETQKDLNFIDEFRRLAFSSELLSDVKIDEDKLESGLGGFEINAMQAEKIFRNLTDSLHMFVRNFFWYDSTNSSNDSASLVVYPAQGENGYAELFLDATKNEGYMMMVKYNQEPVVTFERSIGLYSQNDLSELFENAKLETLNPRITSVPGNYISTDIISGDELSMPLKLKWNGVNVYGMFDGKRINATKRYATYYVGEADRSVEESLFESFLKNEPDQFITFQKTDQGLAFLYQDKLFIRSGDYLSE